MFSHWSLHMYAIALWFYFHFFPEYIHLSICPMVSQCHKWNHQLNFKWHFPNTVSTWTARHLRGPDCCTWNKFTLSLLPCNQFNFLFLFWWVMIYWFKHQLCLTFITKSLSNSERNWVGSFPSTIRIYYVSDNTDGFVSQLIWSTPSWTNGAYEIWT